jgi:hypothetical protein
MQATIGDPRSNAEKGQAIQNWRISEKDTFGTPFVP